jgi:phospholipid/cholesterol/gamma-HCH transport system substrate-binding protein
LDPKVNYTAVGLFVVLLSFILAIAVLWLSSEHVKKYNKYLVYLKEPVSGLTDKAPVKFNGVQVGYVDSITIDPEDPQEVMLVVKVNDKAPINKSTTATLMAQGFTGNTYLGLKAKTSSAPPLEKNKDQRYPVIPSEPSLLVQLNDTLREVTNGLKGMSASFKVISESFQVVLDPQNLASIKNILAKTSTASNQFPDTMEKFRGAAVGLTSASEQVKTTLQNSQGTLRDLDIAIKSLSDQTLPEIYEAARSLKQTLQNVKEVTSTLKQNPSALIRGTKPLPPGPGE